MSDDEYQRQLSQQKIFGRGAGIFFKPRLEDAASAKAARQAQALSRGNELLQNRA